MNILVTGAKGMVGTALVNNLKNIRDHKNQTRPNILIGEIYEYDMDSTKAELEHYCECADFVFHLAGVNRPENPDEFMRGNFGFTSELLACLKSIRIKIRSCFRHPFRRRFQGDSEILNMEEVSSPANNCFLTMERKRERRLLSIVFRILWDIADQSITPRSQLFAGLSPMMSRIW